MHIITAASSNHFQPLCNLLSSVWHHEPHLFPSLVVYDIGLTPDQITFLSATGVTVRHFDFSKFPAHINLHKPQGSRSCAWKPVLIAHHVANFGKLNSDAALISGVLWLDAGCLVHGSLQPIANVIQAEGIYTPEVGPNHTIEKWGHPVTLEKLGYYAYETWTHRTALHYGGVVGFGIRCRELLRLWARACLDRDTIRPAGWTIEKHRSDMVVLSILLYKLQPLIGYNIVNEMLDVSVLNDSLTHEESMTYCKQPPRRSTR